MKIIKKIAVIIYCLVTVGCSVSLPSPEVESNHPANPKGIESAVPRVSQIELLQPIEKKQREAEPSVKPTKHHQMMPGMKM